MKIRKLMLASILTLSSVITGVALVLPGVSVAGVGNDNKSGGKQVVSKMLSITLDCSNPGSHQDASKTPYVTNNTNRTIPKGQKVFWHSTDGDKGTIELDAPLKPGETAVGRGRPGQNYRCTATTSSLF